MSLVKSSLLILSVLVSFNAHAARDFFIRNAEVVSVAVLYDGTRNVVQVRFRASPENVDAASLTCAPTWEQGQTSVNDIKVLSWWSTSAPNSMIQMYYSTAVAAKAQNKLVDLSVKTEDCSNNTIKYGHMWSGIRFSE